MRRMQIILLAVAAASAIGSAALAHRVLLHATEHIRRENLTATVEILGASRTLQAGEQLQSGDLVWQLWPKAALKPGFLLKNETPDAKAAFEGAFMLSPLLAGEPVVKDKLLRRGEGGVLAAQIGEGKRAAAIALRDEVISSGLIAPNDRVDVILLPGKTAGGQTKASTVLPHLRVLATRSPLDQKRGGRASNDKTIIVEVTPQEAQALARARSEGEITVVLNGLGGDGVSSQDLLPGNGPAGLRMIRFGFAVQANLENRR